MLKFFAKYQKIILVVGGSLLMVVFLLPAGGQFLAPDPANEPVGYIDGEEITQRDIRAAQGEIDLLTRLNPRLEPMFRFLEIDGLGWLLAQRDAANNGIYSPLSHARFNVNEQIKAQPELAAALMNMGATPDHLAMAQQHLEMFGQLQAMTLEVRRPSEQRLAHFAKDINSTATVRMVPLKAEDRVDAAADPAEADIVAHFEKYKADKPGESKPHGFGYRLPDRFKLEFITVPIKRVETTIQVDDLAGQKYYLDNPTEFYPTVETPEDNKVGPDTKVGPAPEGPAAPDDKSEGDDKTEGDKPDAPDAPKPAPAPGGDEPKADGAPGNDEECQDEPTIPGVPDVPGVPGIPGLDPDPLDPLTPKLEPLPYKEVREKVFAKLREKRAAEKRDAIAQSIIGELTTALRQSDKAKSQSSGYYKIEGGYEPLALEAVQKTVQEGHDVLVDLERIDDRWLTTEDINDMPGLGSATVEFRDFPAPISFYFASVRELDPKGDSALASLRLQAQVHSRIVYDAAGNAYIFRLTAVEPAHEPESVDEPGVRERVVKDLKTLNVYNAMLKEQEQFLDTARNGGLTKLAEAEGVETVTLEPFAGRKVNETWIGSVTVETPNLDVVGQSDAFVDGVFDIARKVELAGGLGAGKAPPALAVDAIAVPEKMILAIVQLTEYEPIDSARYARIKPSLNGALTSLDAQELGRTEAANPMARDEIAKRVGFERPEGWDTDDDDKEDEADPSETAANDSTE